jgi:hypothetical protein
MRFMGEIEMKRNSKAIKTTSLPPLSLEYGFDGVLILAFTEHHWLLRKLQGLNLPD